MILIHTETVCRHLKYESGGLNSDIHQLFMSNSEEKHREDLKNSEWERAKSFSTNQTDAV